MTFFDNSLLKYIYITTMEIIYADRGVSFRNFIHNILKRSCLETSHIDMLLTTECLEVYSRAFTHSSVDAVNNYEYLEFLGDTTVKKSITWYFSYRFPHLNVEEVFESQLNWSKKGLLKIALDQDFQSYISIASNKRNRNVVVDVFEAFFGATEFLIDKHINLSPGYGCGVCFSIIENLISETVSV
jgi:dsRNA-specific ribonuclease